MKKYIVEFTVDLNVVDENNDIVLVVMYRGMTAEDNNELLAKVATLRKEFGNKYGEIWTQTNYWEIPDSVIFLPMGHFYITDNMIGW